MDAFNSLVEAALASVLRGRLGRNAGVSSFVKATAELRNNGTTRHSPGRHFPP
jgi:hypothetical protein